MKTFHNLNDLGFLPFRPRFKCGSIVSTAMSNDTNERLNKQQLDWAKKQWQEQKDENQLNREYNLWEAQKAREFTTSEREASQNWQAEQFRYQTQNAIPLAMQGAREAGFNPNVVMSNQSVAGGSSVSAPSGPSGSPASYSGGLSPIPFHGQSVAGDFSLLAQGIKSIAEARKSGFDTRKIEQEISNLQVDESMKKTLTDGYKLKNDLDRINLKYADRRALGEIEKIWTDVAVGNSQYDLNTAEEKLKPLFGQVQEALSKKHTQEADFLSVQLKMYEKDVMSQIRLRHAQAEEASQAAETAKQLRPYQTEAASIANSIARVDKRIKLVTEGDVIEQMRSRLSADKSIADEQKTAALAELEKLQKILAMYKAHPAKAKFDATLQNFNKNFPILSQLSGLAAAGSK